MAATLALPAVHHFALCDGCIRLVYQAALALRVFSLHAKINTAAMTANTATSLDLSANDATVLSQLFDPESAASADTTPVDPSLPADPHISDLPLLQSLKATEIRAIRLAESNSLPEACSVLTGLTLSHPTYASAYNNLAQVLRMQSAPPAEILKALSQAISLAAPETPNAPVSPAVARLLGQAYTQRGALLYSLFAKTSKDELSAVGMDRDQLELAASKDFYQGGRYGNELGKDMAVKTNPYARLCGAIVKEALTREYLGGCE